MHANLGFHWPDFLESKIGKKLDIGEGRKVILGEEGKMFEIWQFRMENPQTSTKY